MTARQWIDFPEPQGPIHRVIFSPDGKRLAAMGRDELFNIWEIDGNRFKELPTPKPLDKPKERVSEDKFIATLAFSPKGKLLALGYNDGDVGIWDAEKERWLAEHVNPYKGSPVITSIGFSPDVKWLASGDERGYVILWDAEKCKLLGWLQMVFEGPVASLGLQLR